jgi:hypothetical protein
MSTNDRRSPRHVPTSAFVAFMLLVALLLGACASAGSPLRGVPTTGTGEGTKGLPGDVAGAPAPGTGGVSGTGGTDYSSADLAARRIVKTGAISIEVPNVPSAMSLVRAMALELGGYVGSSQVGTLDQSATLTLRIPAAKFDEAIARLHKIDGTVQTETTQEQDVTSAIVDMAARLTNLQASEAQYRLLLQKAVKVEDILAVQSHLDDVQGQIEQLQAQQKELTGLADLATLTVSLVPGAVQQATSKWDPGKTISDAFAGLVDAVQGVANGAIWFAIVWLPALILLAILLWLLRRLLPGLRRRMAKPAAPAASAAPGAPELE